MRGLAARPDRGPVARYPDIGNFPQAFSHLSLISAAINLDRQLNLGPGSVGPAPGGP